MTANFGCLFKCMEYPIYFCGIIKKPFCPGVKCHIRRYYLREEGETGTFKRSNSIWNLKMVSFVKVIGHLLIKKGRPWKSWGDGDSVVLGIGQRYQSTAQNWESGIAIIYPVFQVRNCQLFFISESPKSLALHPIISQIYLWCHWLL